MRSNTAAGRRYLKRFFPVMIAYVACLWGATWAIRVHDPEGPLLVALAILPALPIIASIGVMGLYLIEEADEYQRRNAVVGMLVGLAVMLSVTTAWGFMEEAGVLPHVPAYYAFVLWCMGWGVAQCAMQLRERLGGSAQ
jgi:hypothetical protein